MQCFIKFFGAIYDTWDFNFLIAAFCCSLIWLLIAFKVT